MTAAEALEQMATEFEQRRVKLREAAEDARRQTRTARTDAAERASKAYFAELHAQIRELGYVIDKLRVRARELRSDATEAA